MLTDTSTSRCLIVLGMHRSGTSCLTGTVEQCGVNLGEVFTQNPFNKKGNRENANIQSINDSLLEFNGGSWNNPVTISAWSSEHIRMRTHILEQLRLNPKGWWGFKDPRVVLTLPFWVEAIDSPSFIATFRHPYRVAMSLHHRDRMPLEAAYQLWLEYNRRLLDWHERYSFDIVNFDLPDQDYLNQVTRRLKSLGLNRSGELFFDPALRHHTSVPEDLVLSEAVDSVFRRLGEVSRAV